MPGQALIRSTGRPALAILATLPLAVWVSGCATTGDPGPAPAHDGLDAVIWQQTSTEYAAVTTGVYAAASSALQDMAPRGGAEDRRRAIVLDVDETVLDNARYQAQLVRDGATYDRDSWDRWISRRAAEAVPGAVDFIRTGLSLDFHIALITNRSCRTRPGSAEACPQRADTLANLEAVGIDASSVSLMLRGARPPARCRPLLSETEQVDGLWSSDKTSRRACVGLEYDVVMLFGDQLGDFTAAEEGEPGESKRAQAADYGRFWGVSWFMLPNPTYGGWRPGSSSDKRALLRTID